MLCTYLIPTGAAVAVAVAVAAAAAAAAVVVVVVVSFIFNGYRLNKVNSSHPPTLDPQNSKFSFVRVCVLKYKS